MNQYISRTIIVAVLIGIIAGIGIIFGVRYFNETESISEEVISNNIPLTTNTEEVASTDVALTTEIIVYSPQRAPTQQTEGTCFYGSLAMPFREDAWRCQPENRSIEDPCFVLEEDKSLVCDRNPALLGDEFLLQLTERLPLAEANTDRESPKPWGWFMELFSGATCNFIGGATGIINGERINFFCNNNTWLIGTPQKGDIWEIEMISVKDSQAGKSNTIPVQIKRIWQ